MRVSARSGSPQERGQRRAGVGGGVSPQRLFPPRAEFAFPLIRCVSLVCVTRGTTRQSARWVTGDAGVPCRHFSRGQWAPGVSRKTPGARPGPGSAEACGRPLALLVGAKRRGCPLGHLKAWGGVPPMVRKGTRSGAYPRHRPGPFVGDIRRSCCGCHSQSCVGWTPGPPFISYATHSKFLASLNTKCR
uniref:Uncharacterized protein n=1 Tax=Rousettus aegyptiacus TaxID=9407 RepID=A0A7J8DIS2_ROUAE|nr:hypothetical protein HJG63_008712 [Rousettus aegyptiacus]